MDKGEEFFKEEQKVEDIKKVIDIFKEYKDRLESIKDAPKGILHISG